MTRTSTANENGPGNAAPQDAAAQNTCSAFFVPDEGRDSRAMGLLQSDRISTPSKHADGLLFECISAAATPENPDPTKYRINIGYNGVASCDCPDFRKRSGACKHLRAALLRLDDMRTAGVSLPDIPIPTTEIEARFFQDTLISPAESFAWAKYAAQHEISGHPEDSENIAQDIVDAFDITDVRDALEEQTITNAFKELWRDAGSTGIPSYTAQQWDQKLPKCLARLEFGEIAPETLAAREQIRNIGPQLFSVASDTVIVPLGPLYRESRAVINSIAGASPTHVLTVYSSPAQQHYHLIPVHADVFTVNCMKFRDFPPSSPPAPTAPGETVTLPVVPCRVPCLATFPILLEYLYTLRDDSLLVSLLPLPPASRKHLTTDQFPQYLAETYALPALMHYILRTYGLWLNVTELGVFNENLWRGMELAWNTLRGALSAHAALAEAGSSDIDMHL